MYPNLRIIVADDSRELRKIAGVEHLRMPYDSGVSAGRNLALSKVETPYVVTLDDDFIFNDRTKLEKWLEILENTNLDLVGGNVDEHPNYYASLHIVDDALVFKPESVGRENNFLLWNIVLQFWMGKTEKIREIGGWDNDFLTCDHIIFFARAIGKIKIGHCPDVGVGHMPIKDPIYYKHRNGRMQQYLRLLMDKLNVKRVVDVHGHTLYTYGGNAIQ
jgi:(N-acetylneuraminyl)-galactosylglucosylceramide N-acetylgalactosaminyltransferase